MTETFDVVRLTRVVAGAAVLAGLAAVIASCSGEGSDAPSTTESPATTTTTITTDTTAPVTAFITEKGHEDIAFSVTMMPQAMPPR